MIQEEYLTKLKLIFIMYTKVNHKASVRMRKFFGQNFLLHRSMMMILNNDTLVFLTGEFDY